MGCAASKAPPKRDPVEELIEEVQAKIDAFAATTTANGGWIRG